MFTVFTELGLVAIGAGIAVGFGCLSSIGEALICCHAIDGMVRQPEMQSKLQSTMIIAVALDESTAIYALITAILLIFIMGSGPAA
ncbi:MAG: ATP synthase F0 subunit C [Bacilli bacterium]|nr:ATP synthase F0 subunit C [Bacilli bacterium]